MRPAVGFRSVLLILVLIVARFCPAGAETGRFLLISDLHFDPFYDGTLFGSLRDEAAEAWPAILARSQPAGFNPRGTDSNYALLASSLDDARRRLPEPDFILYPGDLMAHEWQRKYDALAPRSHREDPASYQAFTAKAIRFLAGQLRQRFPNAPILPTLGNDDSYCGDYMVTPDGAFLAMFAEVWAPLLGPDPEVEAFRATFPRGGYYRLRLPRVPKHRLVVLNSVFFSVNYENLCGTSTQTPALDQLRWLDRALSQARADGETVWLLMHIPPGINSYSSAESVKQGGSPVTFWQPELTSRFLQLVERHPGTIRMAFVGHTHMDDFRVLRLNGRPVLPMKIAPAVSPIFGNNPGYQVYQYDRETGAIQNYQTYYLTDLAPQGPVASGAGRWAFEYDFKEAYGFAALDAGTIDRLADRLGTEAGLQERYTRFYGVSAAPEFTPAEFAVYRCAMANVSVAEFLTCVSGAPKPKRPTPLPDRRRQPAPAAAP